MYSKIAWNRGEVTFFPENFTSLNILSKMLKSTKVYLSLKLLNEANMLAPELKVYDHRLSPLTMQNPFFFGGGGWHKFWHIFFFFVFLSEFQNVCCTFYDDKLTAKCWQTNILPYQLQTQNNCRECILRGQFKHISWQVICKRKINFATALESYTHVCRIGTGVLCVVVLSWKHV